MDPCPIQSVYSWSMDAQSTLHWALDCLLGAGTEGLTFAELKQAADKKQASTVHLLSSIEFLAGMRVLQGGGERDGLTILTVLNPSLAGALLTGSWPFGLGIAVCPN